MLCVLLLIGHLVTYLLMREGLKHVHKKWMRNLRKEGRIVDPMCGWLFSSDGRLSDSFFDLWFDMIFECYKLWNFWGLISVKLKIFLIFGTFVVVLPIYSLLPVCKSIQLNCWKFKQIQLFSHVLLPLHPSILPQFHLTLT